MKGDFDPRTHMLVPKHSKMNKTEEKALFDKYKISKKELPKITKKDPAILHLNPEEGDVIKVERKSPTAGASVYYRVVSNV